MAVSPRIFVSYRRDDASGHAGRLFVDLSEKFPTDVFRDIDTLVGGDDFVQRIEEAVGSADVLIAIIGRGWSNAVDERGRRRLDQPHDWVRLEVGGALRRSIRVIPVLVGGAKMPDAEELPDDLALLARRQSIEISDLDWRSGAERLFTAIERELGIQKTPPPPPPPPLSSAVLPLAFGGAALLAIGPFLRWDGGHSFLENDFGGNLPHGGAFTALAPIGIVVAAVLGALLARTPGMRAIGVGVLFGAGIAGVVKYLRVLLQGGDSAGVAIGVLAALAGGILVVVAALLALRATTVIESARDVRAAVLGIAGAAVMVVATTIDYNGGGTSGEARKLTQSFDGAFDPIMTSLAIAVVGALLLGRWRHAELSAALLTLGVLDALLWVRYLGVPLAEDSSVGSFGAGGLVGLAGAALVIIGGLLGLRASTQPAAVAVPAQT
ncbi:MAG TPA: toll/interleukin-1 receptor domain-containing protein [Gaiellaceae bacterium]|nr:toll/interleukin-1 receptor domain-containing protein [Gaiellaceae bacterium]